MNRNSSDKPNDLPPRFARLHNDTHQNHSEQQQKPGFRRPEPNNSNSNRNRNSNNQNSEQDDVAQPFSQMNLGQSRSHMGRPNVVNGDMLDRPPVQNRRNNFPSSTNGHRQHNQHPNRNQSGNERHSNGKDKVNESQREIMGELLSKAKYECIVCCEAIKFSQKTWNCSNCFNVFHLKCMQMWARQSNVTESNAATANSANGSAANENGSAANGGGGGGQSAQNGHNRRTNRQANSDWRCPTCQCVQKKFPYAYYCFCGKVKDPELSNSWHLPHSCGNTCSRSLAIFNDKGENEVDTFPCSHKCTLKCHPGKCAPCSSKVERTCSCKKTKVFTSCISKISEIQCDEQCNKLLSCGKHKCELKCHFGNCDTCQVKFDLECFCGKETKEEIACSSQSAQFSCNQKCSKRLGCGFHQCQDDCHPGSCGPCPFNPAIVKNCPCGNTLVSELLNGRNRLLCIDPIPTCSKVCNKRLVCGTEAEPHFCAEKCHSGACPPCPQKSILRCECGANSQKFDCKDVTSSRFKCKRRCNKKLSCGRHKCLNECCTDKEHTCRQVCGRKLDCGSHTCDEPCHSFCKSCPNVIWTEVYCNCGEQVLYPPLACSTKRPPCTEPCARVHQCPHPPTHQCHDDPQCPPCTEFVSRQCYGGHETITTVPCYQTGVSCGRFCKKALACGMHHCVKVCHQGDCPVCTQKCTKARLGCDHLCALPCHQSTSSASSSSCPESRCKEVVKVFCKCKLKSQELQCHEVNDPKKFQASVDSMVTRYSFDAITLNEIKQMVQYNTIHQLDCDEKCAKEKRNRELAEALGIEGHSDFPVVKYSDFLKNEARSNPQLILSIHDKLVMLLVNFKKSNSKTMCYNFPPMNRNAREILHNMAAVFGCKSESVDREPNRSIIVTASKTSFIPEVSLLEAINVDANQLRPKQSVVKVKTSSEENKDKKVIDYFNFDGQD
ncbi:PREDICTED: protein shuttle craft-like [Rhagoletis zephyria]|uniref:protein shuttle craft-like n=1 Tax=Rhagoletis zephyria TaxID=28612 RepID=UPI00081136E4|nr:PREDICTED: protein shuttle craft-like [Rhagoletis zephyria]